MQLDRVPLRNTPAPDSGTAPPPCGVEGFGDGHAADGPDGAWEPRPVTRRGRLLFAWLLLAVLGQGERFHLDRRFSTYDATLTTYWEALRANDDVTVWECMADASSSTPYPGMLWFLPPSDELRIASLRALPVERGRMVVSYDVCYRPRGAVQELSFRTSTELVRTQGEWRIAHPIDAASVPAWRPSPSPAGC